LSSGEYPSQWSKGYIHPIHKSGEQDNPSNYRGIVINSCIGKLFTKILNSRLNEFLAKRNVIPIEQIGFTKKKRTVDHMFILRSLVEQHTKKGSKPLYACFIDFRKTFDSVWLQGLFYKMRQIGISDKFYKIVKEMYSKTKLCVKSANSLTELFNSGPLNKPVFYVYGTIFIALCHNRI
jgi:hypothetical protein